APAPTAIAAGTWLVVLAVAGRSSLASLAATAALVAGSVVLQPSATLVAALLAVGIVLSHTDNIRRLLAGDEVAIIRPVRWGRGRPVERVEPAALLEQGPGGAGTAAPELWRRPEAPADAGEDASDDGGST